jgi:SAM-dependent methyltransferase
MQNWYYRIELSNGTFTDGRLRPTLALCRAFFPRIDKTGLRCLDIGTQEFVAPVLFRRQGAAEVVAYDCLDLEDRRRVVAAAYGVEFRYAAGLPLMGLKAHLRQQGVDPVFDYVNFCGVLYHLPDPLTGLAIARSFLRSGGLMLLETSVSLDAGFVAHVNHAGRLYPGSNYFQVSLEALDYWVRMLRMRVVDVAFSGDDRIGRVVAVCRAVDWHVAEPGDGWMSRGFVDRDLAWFGLNFAELGSAAPPVPYHGRPAGHVMRPGLDSVDLYQTFLRTGRAAVDMRLAELRLKDAA